MSNIKIIRDSTIVENDWVLISKLDDPLPEGKIIVPLKLWLDKHRQLSTRSTPVGVWLDSHEDGAALADYISTLPLVAINFPKFTDGRGYSIAALLRDRYGFKGELRAIGDVLRDQLFYMKRVGFNAFAVRADKDITGALAALADFSETYQGSTDEPRPLFRRRAALAAKLAANSVL